MGDYPLSAMLAAPLSETSEKDTNKKYLLDLLTFILIEMKRKSPRLNKGIEKAAILLRKYTSGDYFLKEGIKKRPLNFSQIEGLLKRVKELDFIPFEPKFVKAWSKIYEL